MKIRRYKSNEERAILTALVVHDGVLEKVYRKVGGPKDRPFRSKWSNTVARWCFDFFAKYGRAPRKNIEALFQHYAESAQDKEAVELIDTFLAGLSEEYKLLRQEINEGYMVDKASNYFDEVRLRRLADVISESLDKKDVDEARKALGTYEHIDFSSKAWTDPLAKEAILDTFENLHREDNIVFRWPGELDHFLSRHMERTGFIAFAGPDKRGKSYWLLETAFQALKQRRRVLYYVLGDMSEQDVKLRFYSRLLKRPWDGGIIRWPVDLTVERGVGTVRIRKKHKGPITRKLVKETARLFKSNIAASEPRLRLRADGGGVIAASDIESEMKRAAVEGNWVPDLVVVDYADLLAPEPHTKNMDLRHQINATWMILRRIALDYQCLVVVATQTATTAYKARVIRKADFSEDKRKNAHVTGMIGINQDEDEKEDGLYRLNWIVLRNGRWSENTTCHTASCLDVACPCVLSAM